MIPRRSCLKIFKHIEIRVSTSSKQLQRQKHSMKKYCLPLFIVWIAFFNSQVTAQGTHFKTRAEIEKEELDKMRILKNTFAFSLHYGHFELFPFSKTNVSETNLKIDDYHKQFNVLVEYYPFEKIATLISIGLLVIPKTKEINSITSGENGIQISGSGKGGAILPVTLGMKKTFLNGLARPYISLLSGFTFIKIGTGTGTGSINGIEKNIDYQSKLTFCYQLGSGIQLRTGRVVRFDFGVNYYGSPKFSSPIGGINSFQGLYFFGGMNFILNFPK